MMRSSQLNLSREILYGTVTVFALITWVLAIVVLCDQTESSLGRHLEGAIVIVAAGLFANIFLTPLHYHWHARKPTSKTSNILTEYLLVVATWALMLGGAVAFTPALKNCNASASLCATARALVAFAFMTYAVLSILMSLMLYVVYAAKPRGGSVPWNKSFTGLIQNGNLESNGTNGQTKLRDVDQTRVESTV